jgi:hypothetical protein
MPHPRAPTGGVSARVHRACWWGGDRSGACRRRSVVGKVYRVAIFAASLQYRRARPCQSRLLVALRQSVAKGFSDIKVEQRLGGLCLIQFGTARIKTAPARPGEPPILFFAVLFRGDKSASEAQPSIARRISAAAPAASMLPAAALGNQLTRPVTLYPCCRGTGETARRLTVFALKSMGAMRDSPYARDGHEPSRHDEHRAAHQYHLSAAIR